VDWTAQAMLGAVRTTLGARRWDPHLSFEAADPDGDLILVVVTHQGPRETERLGVCYSLADLSAGPNTGLDCASPNDWAIEVATDLEEFVAYETNERLPGPDGLVMVRWWPTDSLSRP
jgi:hypothetical protein